MYNCNGSISIRFVIYIYVSYLGIFGDIFREWLMEDLSNIGHV